VSTKVGGIPEILPDSMMILSEPTVTDLIEKIKFAIKRHKTGDIVDPIEMHEKIKNMYNWRDVAKRTELVYNRIQLNKDVDKSLINKIHKYYFGFIS
jgi:phosphatidylinositol N-acetylglucosaminyltransferase subunit A